jgi:hypothetical protein
MNELVKRAGLNLVDVIKTPIHGNSYVFVLSHYEKPYYINNLIAMEAKLTDVQTYKNWENTVRTNIDNLKAAINEYVNRGYKIIGYGAAAKGNTLINFGELYLDFIIDDNPLKQGLFAPGSNIPVVAIDMLDECADLKVAFIPLAWNFFTEIQKNIKGKRDKEGDIFIKYFPTISIEK